MNGVWQWTWAEPWAFIFLLFIPAFYWRRHKQSGGDRKFPEISLWSNGLPSWPWRLKIWVDRLPYVAWILLVLALARPQKIREIVHNQALGIDMMVALDTSGSMEALDLKWEGKRETRLFVVKKVVDDFITRRVVDRLGLLVFADHAFLLSPLTLDRQSLHHHVDRLSHDMAGQGTALGDALALAVKHLSSKLEKERTRVVILLSDGVSNAGSISPVLAADLAAERAIKVYTILVGQGGVVPIRRPSFFGDEIAQVRIEVDAETMKDIARKTGGKFFQAKTTEELSAIYDSIDQLEKSEVDSFSSREVKEYYFYFLAAGLCLWGVQSFVSWFWLRWTGL